MLIVTIASCVALVAFVGWALWKMTRGAGSTSPEERCRRDIAALRRTSRARSAARSPENDVWSAGTETAPKTSRKKKATAWGTTGAVGGACGGGGGCGGGCGGCGGCGG